MTHDALWYAEVAGKWGMAEASPMNLRVCRKLGQIEVKRLMRMIDASAPSDMQAYKNLFKIGSIQKRRRASPYIKGVERPSAIRGQGHLGQEGFDEIGF